MIDSDLPASDLKVTTTEEPVNIDGAYEYLRKLRERSPHWFKEPPRFKESSQKAVTDTYSVTIEDEDGDILYKQQIEGKLCIKSIVKFFNP